MCMLGMTGVAVRPEASPETYTAAMRAGLLAILSMLSAGTPCLAQTAPPLISRSIGRGEVSCRAYPPTTQSYKRKLWDGYEISLGPAANSTDGGDNCTAAIYNKEGHVVYRTTGFNVTFDENLTGQDFDGDGHGEVVFETDTGGGNHCCWGYNVISLYPKPHKLFDIDEEGADQFEKDASGRMVIWKRVGAPDVFNGPIAGRPFAQRVYRVRDGKLVDATPEFCERIFGDQSPYNRLWTAELSPENVEKFKSEDRPHNGEEQVARALLERAYQHVLCRQFDDAIADLDLWPAASRAEMKADFAKQINSDFPDFAARLVQSSRSK
jgi:hypothetical protein